MGKVGFYTTLAVITVLAGATTDVSAETPTDFLQTYAAEAKTADNRFAGFSAERGMKFFTTTPDGGEWSCASCHTQTPLRPGQHAKTGKIIDPLAPAANPERFTSTGKVEKWFRRNCNDVLNRACTPLEKGDVLTYLLSLKP